MADEVKAADFNNTEAVTEGATEAAHQDPTAVERAVEDIQTEIEAMVKAEVAKAVGDLREGLTTDLAKAKGDILEEANQIMESIGKLVADVTPHIDLHSRIQALEEDLKKVSVKVRQNLG